MAGFNSWFRTDRSGRKTSRRFVDMTVILFVLLSCLIIAAPGHATVEESIAVLPFNTGSGAMEDLSYEMQAMLIMDLKEKGLDVIGADRVNGYSKSFKTDLTREDIIEIQKGLEADWLILGNLVQTGVMTNLAIKAIHVGSADAPILISLVDDSPDGLDGLSEKVAVAISDNITGIIRISSIQIKGNRRVEGDAILAVIESREGGKYDPVLLDRDLRFIFQMGYFKNVNIMAEEGPEGKIVIIEVLEKPSIGQISFEENDVMRDKLLEEEVAIKRFSILDHTEIMQNINMLKDFYQRKAYYNIEVTYRIEELPNNEVTLIFVIDEGEKVHVRNIRFIGNVKFDDDDLKDEIKTNEKGFWFWLTQSGKLDRTELEFDIAQLKAFYQRQGYKNSNVGDPEITYDKKTGLTITIEITEGEQYTVNDINFEGDLIKPEWLLLNAVSLQKDDIYNPEILYEDVQSIKTIYGNEGYAYTDVEIFTNDSDESGRVDITYDIEKKKQVYVERINITGNSKTRDNVIRREFEIVESELFSYTGIKESQMNLYRLGFFEEIELTQQEGIRDDLVTLGINVKERATGSLSAGIGYSSYDGFNSTFQLSQENLFGRGQKLAASASFGKRTRQYDISFTEPWFLGKRLSAGFDIYDIKNEYDEYTKESFGGSLRFGFPISKIDKFTWGIVRYAYDEAFITIDNYINEEAGYYPDTQSSLGRGNSEAILDMEGQHVTRSLSLGVSRSSKDHPWNTTRGSVNKITFETAGGILKGDVAYNKYEARSAWYFPIWWDHVYVIQGRAGLVHEKPGGTLPVYKKFTLGGMNTVRGYRYGTISPMDGYDKIGGEIMWVANLEYRIPLIKDAGVVALFFVDLGGVSTLEEGFIFDGAPENGSRGSIGTGFRWYSPVGPLRLEFGKKMNRREGESAGNWEFTIGGLL